MSTNELSTFYSIMYMVLTRNVTKQLISDLANVFERFHQAMEAFCESDNLRQRLLAVRLQLAPLLPDDFPAQSTCENRFVRLWRRSLNLNSRISGTRNA